MGSTPDPNPQRRMLVSYTIEQVVADLVSNGYEPPIFSKTANGKPCPVCQRAAGDIEIMYFSDGSCGDYQVCGDCARAIWRGARDQGRDLRWQTADEQEEIARHTDDLALFERLIEAAVERSDGHFTIMRFTTNWRVALWTPADYSYVDFMPVGDTFAAAARAALDAPPDAPTKSECDAAFEAKLAAFNAEVMANLDPGQRKEVAPDHE